MNSPRQLIDDLTALETIKTWSLIVTLFGDLKGEHLPGKQINQLLGHIGIKAEAIRVALHRLKSDGWIRSERNGREVIYSLSEHGMAQTTSVTDFVYRAEPKYRDGWQLVLHNGSETPNTTLKSKIQISRNMDLVPAGFFGDAEPGDTNRILLSFDQDLLPQWFGDQIVNPDMIEIANRLYEIANRYSVKNEIINSLDTLAIRLLLLHHWRKIALRENSWAHIALYPEGPISLCQRIITAHLRNMPLLSADLLKSYDAR